MRAPGSSATNEEGGGKRLSLSATGVVSVCVNRSAVPPDDDTAAERERGRNPLVCSPPSPPPPPPPHQSSYLPAELYVYARSLLERIPRPSAHTFFAWDGDARGHVEFARYTRCEVVASEVFDVIGTMEFGNNKSGC